MCATVGVREGDFCNEDENSTTASDINFLRCHGFIKMTLTQLPVLTEWPYHVSKQTWMGSKYKIGKKKVNQS